MGAGDQFGHSVSISGDMAIIGAFTDEDNGSESGSAYVYTFDSDWDGIPSWWELLYGLDPDYYSDAYQDSDTPQGDGLTNLEEYQYGTDPTDPDTDDDTFSDGDEIAAGTDPLDPLSHPDAGCICDFDADGDVDGDDLATYAEGGSGISLAVCASEFGETSCW